MSYHTEDVGLDCSLHARLEMSCQASLFAARTIGAGSGGLLAYGMFRSDQVFKGAEILLTAI